jgi:hypothetical protein
MSQGTISANVSTSKAAWNIGAGCGPTGSSRHRPIRTVNRESISSRTTAARDRSSGSR